MSAVLEAPELMQRDELRDLTGKAHASAQAAWLSERGVPHRLDGRRVILSRAHVRDWLEGKTVRQSSGINWEAVR